MIRIKREEILGKAISSISAGISHAQSLASALAEQDIQGGLVQDIRTCGSPEAPRGTEQGDAPPTGEGAGTSGSGRSGDDGDKPSRSRLQLAYASALRCRLEIQYALLLIQKGLSVEVAGAAGPPSRTSSRSKLARELNSDLEGAISALRSGSLEGAGSLLAASDAKAAQIISKIRNELKQSSRWSRQNKNP